MILVGRIAVFVGGLYSFSSSSSVLDSSELLIDSSDRFAMVTVFSSLYVSFRLLAPTVSSSAKSPSLGCVFVPKFGSGLFILVGYSCG